ncbi:MAG TPA: LuxR C-terminal-related transcriptional regulator [Terriglobales bacterium]|nr:LuxR C-terminal-related transcriptional regulator [Terriglobales bacterium]
MADESAPGPDRSPSLEQLSYLVSGIFNAPSVGLAVFDTEARVVMSNPAFASMIADASPPALNGKTIRQIMGDAGEDLELAIKQFWEAGRIDARVEVSRRSSQNREVSHWDFNLIPSSNDTSGLAQVIAIAIETNHEKKVEAYLLHLMADMNWIRDQIAKDRPSLEDRREMLVPLGERIGLLDALSREVQRVSTLLRCGPTVRANGTVTDSQLTAANHRDHRRSLNLTKFEPPLSPREQEVLKLIASDKVSKEIGSMLGITAKSVDTVKSRIMLKLHVHSTTALVIYAIRNHIVSLDATAGDPESL